MSKLAPWPAMNLPIAPPFAPTGAMAAFSLPRDEGWQFEPKWDGVRCVAFRDGDQVVLQSKTGQPLTRYFPEIAVALRSLKAPRFVVDGELVVPMGSAFSFDDLMQRIHPARNRIEDLAAATPALFLLFDMLVDTRGRELLDRPLADRRRALEDFARAHLVPNKQVRLSPATTERWVVDKWHSGLRGRGASGIMAKRLELAYLSGEPAMQKVKWIRVARCVVGGFRYDASHTFARSLLLGLYDRDGLLDHVGFCAIPRASDRAAITARLEAIAGSPGFNGHAPHGSRTRERPDGWVPTLPLLVVEVDYDHFRQGHFRHAVRLVRFLEEARLEDPALPRQCLMSQVEGKSATVKRPRPRSHARVA